LIINLRETVDLYIAKNRYAVILFDDKRAVKAYKKFEDKARPRASLGRGVGSFEKSFS